MRVRLHGILFDQEFDALIEGCGDRRRLLAQQHLHRIVGGQAHDVLGADWMRTALAVRAIRHAVCEWKKIEINYGRQLANVRMEASSEDGRQFCMRTGLIY